MDTNNRDGYASYRENFISLSKWIFSCILIVLSAFVAYRIVVTLGALILSLLFHQPIPVFGLAACASRKLIKPSDARKRRNQL